MDFINRSGQARPNTSVAPQQTNTSAPSSNSKKDKPHPKWFRLSYVILLFSGTILVVALLLYINFGGSTPENKQINKNDYQAVFVNVTGTSGGQVYFGRIQNLTGEYIRMTNVFYIQNQQSGSNTSNKNSSYNLVKLGCELHGPEDEMMINRSQVFFWENLKASGQVSQKIAQYYKENPGSQKCSDSQSSNSTNQGSSNTTNNSSNSTNNNGTTNDTSNNTSSNNNTGTGAGTTH